MLEDVRLKQENVGEKFSMPDALPNAITHLLTNAIIHFPSINNKHLKHVYTSNHG